MTGWFSHLKVENKYNDIAKTRNQISWYQPSVFLSLHQAEMQPLKDFDLAHINDFAFQKLLLLRSRRQNQLLTEEFEDEEGEYQALSRTLSHLSFPKT